MIKQSLVMSLILSAGLSNTLDDNFLLKSLEDKNKSLYEKVKYSDNLKNPILSIGVTDFQDDLKRDKEAMQSQFILFSQELEWSKKRDLKKKISLSEYKESNLKIKLEKIKLYLKVISLNDESKNIKERLSLIIEKKDKLIKLINLSKKEYELNYVSKVEVSKLKLLLADIELDIEKLKRELYTKERKAQKITKNNFIYSQMDYLPVLNFEIKNNILFDIYEEKISKLNNSINLKREELYPNVKVNAGYYQRENREDYMNFSVSIPLPIYGTEKHKIVEEKYKKESVEDELSDLKIKVEEEKNILINDINYFSKSINIIEETLIKEQRSIMKDVKNYYENNSGKLTNLIKEEIKLIDLKIKLLKVKNNYEKSFNSLRFYKEEF